MVMLGLAFLGLFIGDHGDSQADDGSDEGGIGFGGK